MMVVKRSLSFLIENYLYQRTTTSLKLAYAITIHKSQGSEFPVVIIPPSYKPLYYAAKKPYLYRTGKSKKTPLLRRL